MISMNEKVAKKIETKSELDKAFVDADNKVLDPTLLKKSLLERMPNPSGWRLLVLPYKGKGVTDAGIQLVQETVDREALKKGEWILIGRYAGTRFRLEDNHEVRIINDDEVIATILNPDDIKSL